MEVTVDVENDGEFLRNIIEDKGYPHIAAFIKRAFDTVIPQKAIDFRTNVGRVIQQCLSMHGIPMFRTRYAGQQFPINAALMICYGSHNGRLKGVWFKDIPTEDFNILVAKGGWQEILRKYGKSEGIPGIAKHSELEESLKAIEEKLKYALADEETAIPFYGSLKTDIEIARVINPIHTSSQMERETDRYLFSMQSGIRDIREQEIKHKERITNMLKAIQELRRTFELERTTDRPQEPQSLRLEPQSL